MEEEKESKQVISEEDKKILVHTRKKMGILQDAFAGLDWLEAMVAEEMPGQETGKFTSADDAQAFLKEYLDKNK
jgi:hypothetical protein